MDPADPRLPLVRKFYDAWASADLQRALECIHPDMEFDWSESMAPFRGVYRGHEGMRAYYHDIRDAFDPFEPSIDEIIDCGAGGLVTVNTVRGRARIGDFALEAHAAMRWRFRDGKIVSGKMFQTPADALEDTAGEQ
jgi:ketosteroid isomerase-like protein